MRPVGQGRSEHFFVILECFLEQRCLGGRCLALVPAGCYGSPADRQREQAQGGTREHPNPGVPEELGLLAAPSG